MGNDNLTDGGRLKTEMNSSPNFEVPPQLRTGSADDSRFLKSLVQNAVIHKDPNPPFFVKWPLNATVLARLDPGCWLEVLSLRNRDGAVEGEDLEKLRHLVSSLKFVLPEEEEFEQSKRALATEGIFTLEDWHRDLEEQRRGLITFLEQAFEIGC